MSEINDIDDPCCQRLIGAPAENSVFDLQVLPFTYLDDILAAGARRDLKRAVRRLKGRLQRARFVVRPKSSLDPTRVLDFVGKIFDTKRRRMENRKGIVTALLRSWLRLRLGLVRRKGFEMFLGRLEWALRPQGGMPRFWLGRIGGSCLVNKGCR